MTPAEFCRNHMLRFGVSILFFGLRVAKLANNHERIFIVLLSATAWLMSYYISMFAWQLAWPDMRHVLQWLGFKNFASGLWLLLFLVFVVTIQELGHYCMYLWLRSMVISEHQYMGFKFKMQHVVGIGCGIAAGAVLLIVNLYDSADLELNSGVEYMYLLLPVILSTILFHTFWNVISFSAFDEKSYSKVMWVIVTHVFVSWLNHGDNIYVQNTLITIVILIVTGIVAFKYA